MGKTSLGPKPETPDVRAGGAKLRIEEFEDALDQYGPEIDEWPSALAQQARDLLASSIEARDLLEAEAIIAGSLRSSIKAPSGLADRLVAQAFEKEAAQVVAARQGRSWWEALVEHVQALAGQASIRYATVLAICFVGGVAVAQITAQDENIPAPTYLSGLYADLAW